jgi:hypothetical protein
MDNIEVVNNNNIDVNNTREIEFSFCGIIYFYIDIYTNICSDIINCFS